MKKILGIALIVFLAAAWASAIVAPQAAKAPVWEAIKGGKRNHIGAKVSFNFKPSEKPKVGTVNLRVQIMDKAGKADKAAWALKGAVSLAGQPVPPDSAFKPFNVNKAGLYVLPLTIATAGKWEFRMVILKAGKVVYRGLAKFVI